MIEILSAGDQLRRDDIVAQCQDRFGLGERKVAEMIEAERPFLKETMAGHSKGFEIDLDKVDQAPWCRFMFG